MRVRPDMTMFRKLMPNEDKYWGMHCSTKLLSSEFTEVISDLNSTDPTKFYCKRDGTENPKATNLYKSFNKLLKSKDVVGNFRLHIILPGISNQTQKLIIEKKDIIVYVDKTNFSKFCLDPEMNEVVQRKCLQE